MEDSKMPNETVFEYKIRFLHKIRYWLQFWKWERIKFEVKTDCLSNNLGKSFSIIRLFFVRKLKIQSTHELIEIEVKPKKGIKHPRYIDIKEKDEINCDSDYSPAGAPPSYWILKTKFDTTKIGPSVDVPKAQTTVTVTDWQ
jgi:hypothetical protein